MSIVSGTVQMTTINRISPNQRGHRRDRNPTLIPDDERPTVSNHANKEHSCFDNKLRCRPHLTVCYDHIFNTAARGHHSF